MARRKEKRVDVSRRPSMTPEGRENEVVAMAYDMAEEQIRNRTASSQVLTYFLKMGASRERIEREILAEQKKLVSAKTEAIESEKKDRVDYEKVLSAMKRYSGDEE